MCGYVASLSPSDKPIRDFTKMGIWKRDLANRDVSSAEKQKIPIPGMKFKLTIKEAFEEKADYESVDSATIRETRYAARGT